VQATFATGTRERRLQAEKKLNGLTNGEPSHIDEWRIERIDTDAQFAAEIKRSFCDVRIPHCRWLSKANLRA
jgi:hypothetical protein